MCGAELGEHKLQTVSWGNRRLTDGKQHVKTGNKMADVWLFPSENRCISSKLENMKNCAVMETACSCLEAILLDFLKIREEISVSLHILRIFLELLKYFLKSFSSEAL